MTKRDEEIGRAADAAFKAQEFWDADWSVIALAAVAKAREIDTCGTCKHGLVGGHTTHFYYCGKFDFQSDMIGGVGCNRHEPKGE